MKRKKKFGTVYLIGGGPGDPGLLTLKGKEILSRADAVVYDALVSKRLLSFSPAQAEKIRAGKRGGRRKIFPQEDINKLLVTLAGKYKTVARLKGGDPFIFGRGGEEMLSLRHAGVPFKVIPGITAALGAAAYAGIPLTHREFVSQVVFATGHEARGKEPPAMDWRELASGRKTVVFYMGAKTFPAVIRKLRENGLPGETPVAVVENATVACQRVIEGKLNNIGERILRTGIASPSLVIVGEVVRLRKSGGRDVPGPLAGKTVVVTRARHQAGEMSRRLAERGARVIEFPVIQVEPPASWEAVDREIDRLKRYEWIFFSSVNGVERFFERFFEREKDLRDLSHLKIGAIGPATAEKLKTYHLKADFMPSDYVSEVFADTFLKGVPLTGKRILLIRAEGARIVLKERLEKRNAAVTELTVYRIRPPRADARDMICKLRAGGIDLVSFTSPSAVENFLRLVGKRTFRALKRKPLVASIGPVTSRAARRLGLRVSCQPKRYTIPDLVSAVQKTLAFGKMERAMP